MSDQPVEQVFPDPYVVDAGAAEMFGQPDEMDPYAMGMLTTSPEGYITASEVAAFYLPRIEAPTQLGTTVNVRNSDYGATGSGTGDESAAINSAITANPGKTIHLTQGGLGASIYQIDAVAGGIKMNQPGTRLLLDPGVTLKVAPNSATAYMLVEVTAADCTIEGGTFLGDVGTHTGTTGEWGHLIVGNAGSDRLRVRAVKVTKAWGDGICLQGGAADQSILDVIADNNRRQGMSITNAVRPRVMGGVYENTGLTANTAPSAGIDVEPNATTSVTDAQLVGVTFKNNRGPGLQVATATGALAEVTIIGGRTVGSTNSTGFYAVGPAGTIKAKAVGLHSLSNAQHGFTISTEGVELTACTGRLNTLYGFQVNSSYTTLNAPVALENGGHGIQVTTGADSSIIGGLTRSNSQTTNGAYVNVDITGTGVRIIGHLSDAGTLTNKPAYGYLLRSGATVRTLGSDARGAFTAAAYSDLSGAGNSIAFPVPGVAKQTLAAAATDAATTQTLANSLRTALINLGWGS